MKYQDPPDIHAAGYDEGEGSRQTEEWEEEHHRKTKRNTSKRIEEGSKKNMSTSGG